MDYPQDAGRYVWLRIAADRDPGLEAFLAFHVSELSPQDVQLTSNFAEVTKRHPGLLNKILQKEERAKEGIRNEEEYLGHHFGRSGSEVEQSIRDRLSHRKNQLLDHAYKITFPERDDSDVREYGYKKQELNDKYGFKSALRNLLFGSDSDSD